MKGCSKIAAALLMHCWTLLLFTVEQNSSSSHKRRGRPSSSSFVVVVPLLLTHADRCVAACGHFCSLKRRRRRRRDTSRRVITHTHTLSTCTSVTNRAAGFFESYLEWKWLSSPHLEKSQFSLCVCLCVDALGQMGLVLISLFSFSSFSFESIEKLHQPSDWSLQVQLHCSIVRAVLFSCHRALL